MQQAIHREAQPKQALLGRCQAMQDVYTSISGLAKANSTVLILGESGTGKELVARALHEHGPRPHSPFRAINCAGIPETLLESELFGHEAGAFTGAVRRRIGKFELCDNGSIFLDEIGDTPLPVQARMLRVLQEQCFERVGGNDLILTNVRLMAATNHELASLVQSKLFRESLYYRLNGITIRLPPLRERGE